MFQNNSRLQVSRFAWLTPLDGQNNSNGPWLLADNDSFQVEHDSSDSISKVSVKGLLDLIMGVLDVDSPETQMKTDDQWQSKCNRFSVRWHRQDSDTSRLFIQQKSDYFARVELYIDGNLLAAYQEPVWPHLQRTLPTQVEKLSVPCDCISALQNGCKHVVAHRVPQESANQETNMSTSDYTQTASMCCLRARGSYGFFKSRHGTARINRMTNTQFKQQR